MTIANAVYREGVAFSPDGAMYVTPTGTASITGGTLTGTNVPYVLASSSLPLIGLSTGSVAANGAISAITALPVAYPHAFCYFPANALATAIAAGWYYCTFSTTTAGTAFLNSWTPGTAPPTVPSSPTAVVDGKGAFTGDTTEQGLIVPVAANAMGPNGRLIVTVRSTYTNSAGTKTFRVRFSGAAGTIHMNTGGLTTTVANVIEGWIANDGTTGTQFSNNVQFLAPNVVAQAASTNTSSVDTTAAGNDLRITAQRNTATDNAVIESIRVQLQYGS